MDTNTPSHPSDEVAEHLRDQELAWLRLVAEAEAAALHQSTKQETK